VLTLSSIAQLRLRNQWIDAPVRGDATAVVKRLVAVQAQDYAGAKWALGLRLRDSLEDQIERAFNEGKILRTHVLRPTWHFVLPEDIRWLLGLTGPRVQAANAGMQRKAGLDAATFRRAERVLAKALDGGARLTRVELRAALKRAGLDTEHEFRFAYVLMHAELEGLICSGPRRGKQFTYALLDERAPAGGKRTRDQAVVELTRRYFVSRGPATAHDFAKWSGLTLADARLGLEAAGRHLQRELFDGKEYWSGEAFPPIHSAPLAHLLSVFDEYVSSYKGHAAIAPEEISRRLRAFGNVLTGIIVVGGVVTGTWKRTLTNGNAHLKLEVFGRIAGDARKAVVEAAERYARFHGVKAVLTWRMQAPISARDRRVIALE
jgi:hypothetical protein